MRPPPKIGSNLSPNKPNKPRWSSKPEQIEILESSYNRGVVNPKNSETSRIRELLERFGPVSDENISNWFRNRRAKDRYRQRKLAEEQKRTLVADTPTSTTMMLEQETPPKQVSLGFGSYGGYVVDENDDLKGVVKPTNWFSTTSVGFDSSSSFPVEPSPQVLVGSSSTTTPRGALLETNPYAENLVPVSDQMGYNGIDQPNIISFPSDQTQYFQHQPYQADQIEGFQYQDDQNLSYQQQPAAEGFITVYINGGRTQVRGHINVREIFGEGVFLVHQNSGIVLAIDELGFLKHTLEAGESYILI